MKLLILLLILTSSFNALAKKRVKYEYKKYERFDFDALDVEGSRSAPGVLTIPDRQKTKHKNKLPERKNFNREMKNAIDTIL